MLKDGREDGRSKGRDDARNNERRMVEETNCGPGSNTHCTASTPHLLPSLSPTFAAGLNADEKHSRRQTQQTTFKKKQGHLAPV